MRISLILLLVSCAAAPLKPTPDQMPQGRVMCANLCAEHKRRFCAYDYEGRCICTNTRGSCE